MTTHALTNKMPIWLPILISVVGILSVMVSGYYSARTGSERGIAVLEVHLTHQQRYIDTIYSDLRAHKDLPHHPQTALLLHQCDGNIKNVKEQINRVVEALENLKDRQTELNGAVRNISRTARTGG